MFNYYQDFSDGEDNYRLSAIKNKKSVNISALFINIKKIGRQCKYLVTEKWLYMRSFQ